jgi:hypothetical protein
MPTNNAHHTTAAPINPDALHFECVIFSDFVRHELNRIKRLSHICTTPRKVEIHNKCDPLPTQISDSRVADPHFVRPKRYRLTHNTNPLNGLNLYAHKLHFFALLRPRRSYLRHLSAGSIFFNTKASNSRSSIRVFGAALHAATHPFASTTANRLRHISSSEPRFNNCSPRSTARQRTSPCPDS